METDDAFSSMMSGAASMSFIPANGPSTLQPQMIQAPQPPTQPIFGILIPGHTLRTDFVPTDPSGLKYTLNLTAPPPDLSYEQQQQHSVNPTSIPDIAFFLLPTTTLPPNHGVLLYYQASSTYTNESTGFELLGALTQAKPSGLFRTSWPTHEFFTTKVAPNNIFSITLGVSIEPLENIQNLSGSTGSASITGGIEERVNFAQKIALNLYNYMQSFDNGGAAQGQMTVPVKVFQRWLERFEKKCRLDPNFFMKDNGDGS
mmetsp:Transcript_24762/g.36326  ORF Transcript_24762/g.36326 Transcript_24762/m.36326 type:complete len:259 (+) Transcript_24762:66-842(+)